MRTLALVALVLALGPGAAGADEAAEAARVLAEAARAYRGLHVLSQETTFTGDSGTFARPVRTHLVFRRPNRLLLELWQKTPDRPEPVVTRCVCDGETLWVYREAQGYYTRDRAPKDARAFLDLGASLELAAIAGIDPFAGLAKQTRLRLLPGEVVDGVMTDLVAVDVSGDRLAEARLYVGRQDRLIRRFVYDAPEKRLGGERLSEGARDTQNLTLPAIRYQYDNAVSPDTKPPDSVFRWQAPPGAMEFRPLSQLLGPGERRGGRPGYVIVDGKGEGRRVKPLSMRDLIDMAHRQKRR
ncbi:MAG: DUF2092 domain-containing protein [Chthonomonadales bacterium]|nr:DUF2092 domain-containing protein [Chthonomonadales bacterium]